MWASLILLYGSLALGTLVRSYLVSPVLVQLLLSLITSLPLVPRNLTFIAEVFLTLNALCLKFAFNDFIDCFTARVWTKLLIL